MKYRELIDSLYEKYLRKVLRKRCSGWIRTSGDGAEDVDCYGVHLKVNENETVNVSAFDGTMITLREYPNERPEDFTERQIPINEVSHKDFVIIHYLGLSRIEFRGLSDLFWSEVFRIPGYLRWTDRIKSEIRQRRFNLKKFETVERIDLLKVYLKHNKKGVRFSTVTELMLVEHGHEYFSHPRKDEIHEETRFLRNTLCELGELGEGNEGYYVTGKGYMAIVDSEEDERKHTENLMLQKKLVYLTFILAISGIAAGYDQFERLGAWGAQRLSSLVQFVSSLW